MGGNKNKSFIFTWNVENYSLSLQKKGEHIASPPFIAETIEKTKWNLIFFPAGNQDEKYIAIYLKRHKDCKGPPAIEIEYELSLSIGSELVLKSSVFLHSFLKGQVWVVRNFLKKEKVFPEKGVDNLPQDTLTICCKMWKCVGSMEERVECVARTRIGVERKSFDWAVEQVSDLESKTRSTYIIRSVSEGKRIMSLNFFIAAEGIICLKLNTLCENLYAFHLRGWILDASGALEQNTIFECNFHDTLYKKLYFPFHLKKDELITTIYSSFVNDELTLRCECAFSTGIAFSGIESIVYGCNTSSMNSAVSDPLSNIVARNLKSVLREQLFCDTKLKTKTRCFPAHKCILGACSPVFKALFTKEGVEECVNVEDLDDDAVEQMLQYVYLGELGGLEWESACKLHDVAAKFEILCLKNECSSFLKTDLTPSKACEALIHADKKKDDDLKKAVQNFIVEHGKDIINSNAWKELMGTHLQLAADTMILKFI
ncbi:TD and POZ domain-containing protein 1-like [Trichonephila inaurata madagascariensis]|uniref:TD and POZ domain-containing protein 1-like n=1 Tax=Trichonephila inaurata madagascariensis TaxID=2747483 RepID=A0A8X6YVV5_9ARAC|nr:TD and POZ domain-containing protein 1-like [Trichonephila inaurata madagascariensis]